MCTYLIQKNQYDDDIITGDVYNCYLELQSQLPGLNKLTQRRVSELLRELDLAGIINARVVSKGQYGRSKMIRLNIPLEEKRRSIWNRIKNWKILWNIVQCVYMTQL